MTTNFPKMGEFALTDSIVNVSGNRSPYTHPRAKGGPSGDSESEPATVRGVGSMATGESAGPCFSPQTTIDFPNAPEAAQTGRGLRVMRSVASKTGNGDFWDNRSATGAVIDGSA